MINATSCTSSGPEVMGRCSEGHWGFPLQVQILKDVTFGGWCEGTMLRLSSLLNLPSARESKKCVTKTGGGDCALVMYSFLQGT